LHLGQRYLGAEYLLIENEFVLGITLA